MSNQHVIIVGAGLGGPALAIALAKQSIRSTILERRASREDIGGVITLAANAMRVMKHLLGIEERLRQVGQSFDYIQHFTQASVRTGLAKAGTFPASNDGTGALCVMRPGLHEMLLEECRRDEMKGLIDLRYGAKVKEVKEDKEGVSAVLEDGTEIQGKL